MLPVIHAAIISEDPVSSAILSRALKEWHQAAVDCEIFPSAAAATSSRWFDYADVVFVSELNDEDDIGPTVAKLCARDMAPACYVVTSKGGHVALSSALRAGARDYINRYVVREEDVHRCLWRVLKEREASLRHQLNVLAMQPAV